MLNEEQKELAAKVLLESRWIDFYKSLEWNFESCQRELAEVGLAIQPMSAGFVNVKLLSACRQALKVVSEIADIDAENRAGWCHKELQEAVDEATAIIQPINKKETK